MIDTDRSSQFCITISVRNFSFSLSLSLPPVCELCAPFLLFKDFFFLEQKSVSERERERAREREYCITRPFILGGGFRRLFDATLEKLFRMKVCKREGERERKRELLTVFSKILFSLSLSLSSFSSPFSSNYFIFSFRFPYSLKIVNVFSL